MQRKEGLVHVLTGDGNGKTTSAVGIAVRALGRGLKVAFVQFLKGGLSGEISRLEALGATVITKTKHCKRSAEHEKSMSENGYIIFCADCFRTNELDRVLVADAFEKARKFSTSGEYGLVVLDEVFIALGEKLLTEEQIASLIGSRHPSCELVLTGRGAPESIESLADYVTYVKKNKHPFDRGVLSRSGIDY